MCSLGSYHSQPGTRSSVFERRLTLCRTLLQRCSVWGICLLAAMAGCSGSGMDESLVQSGETGLQEAIKLIESNQAGQAMPLLEKSINQGGLNADLLSMALVLRARCHIEAGNTDAAAQDLDRAEQGSAPLDQFHLTKGLLLKKLGKAQEASAEFAKAKKISPKIKIPQ